MKRTALILFAVLVCTLSLTAYAQSDRGTLTGTVSDSNGAAVPGATVIATNISTNSASSAVTTSEGVYVIPALQPGSYKVRVEKAGFKTAEVSGVGLITGNTATANVTLAVGQVSEVVEIASAGGAQVQTENAKVSSQVSNNSSLG